MASVMFFRVGGELFPMLHIVAAATETDSDVPSSISLHSIIANVMPFVTGRMVMINRENTNNANEAGETQAASLRR